MFGSVRQNWKHFNGVIATCLSLSTISEYLTIEMLRFCSLYWSLLLPYLSPKSYIESPEQMVKLHPSLNTFTNGSITSTLSSFVGAETTVPITDRPLSASVCVAPDFGMGRGGAPSICRSAPR